MFLDKLWLRIRGELLTLKEDLSAGDDIRERAANLLDRVEHRISGEDMDRHGKGGDAETRNHRYGADAGGHPDSRSLDELKKEWDVLKKQRDGSLGDLDEFEPPPPNPRQLG